MNATVLHVPVFTHLSREKQMNVKKELVNFVNTDYPKIKETNEHQRSSSPVRI